MRTDLDVVKNAMHQAALEWIVSPVSIGTLEEALKGAASSHGYRLDLQRVEINQLIGSVPEVKFSGRLLPNDMDVEMEIKREGDH